MIIRYGTELITAQVGDCLLDALLRASIDHRHICGGLGFCTSCRVEVVGAAEGLSPPSALERERLGSRVGELRLACQARIRGKVCVQVPRAAAPRFSPFEDEESSIGF